MKHQPVTTLDDVHPGKVYRLDAVLAVLPLHRSTVYRHAAAGVIAATRPKGAWLVLGAEVRPRRSRPRRRSSATSGPPPPWPG